LRGIVLAHGLLGLGAPFGFPGHSLFRCKYSRRAS
jgi:hypothetical protein